MDDLVIIENKIYEIRGQKVMLDFDLAEMYEIETKVFETISTMKYITFFQKISCSDSLNMKVSY